MPRYNPATIEPKWQAYWDEHQTFAAPPMPGPGGKLYVLDMFPYPSGDGLHVGHPEGYTATDIVCRSARMRGKSVMHPMGWDAFGLPAEEHAIKTGDAPARCNTEKNIATFRRQLKMLGFRYDWDRELATTDADYFRWTQWIFLQLFDTWFDAEQQRGRPIAELPIPADVTAARRRRRSHAIRTSIAWPISSKPRSTGARRWARCWPTKKSSTARANAAAIPSCACRCGNGCCGSPPTPTGSKTISTASTGPKASRRCSATGSAAAPAPRSISSSARIVEPHGEPSPRRIRSLANRSRR